MVLDGPQELIPGHRRPAVDAAVAPGLPLSRNASPDLPGMLSVGLLSGGYGEDELLAAGAFRVYRDAGELHRSIDELGI